MMHISPEFLKMLGYDRVKHFDRKACQAVVEITFIICLMHEKVALDFWTHTSPARCVQIAFLQKFRLKHAEAGLKWKLRCCLRLRTPPHWNIAYHSLCYFQLHLKILQYLSCSFFLRNGTVWFLSWCTFVKCLMQMRLWHWYEVL